MFSSNIIHPPTGRSYYNVIVSEHNNFEPLGFTLEVLY